MPPFDTTVTVVLGGSDLRNRKTPPKQGLRGAIYQIRTGDLLITNQLLYQLS